MHKNDNVENGPLTYISLDQRDWFDLPSPKYPPLIIYHLNINF